MTLRWPWVSRKRLEAGEASLAESRKDNASLRRYAASMVDMAQRANALIVADQFVARHR